MSRVFFVVDLDHEFNGDMREAATWLEGQLDRSRFDPRVIAYRSLDDMTFDAADKEGAFKP